MNTWLLLSWIVTFLFPPLEPIFILWWAKEVRLQQVFANNGTYKGKFREYDKDSIWLTLYIVVPLVLIIPMTILGWIPGVVGAALHQIYMMLEFANE